MTTIQASNDSPLRENFVDQTQKNRIRYLDAARGIAIFLMILQHAVIIYAVDEGESDLLGNLILLAGTAPAAPVFLLIMGIFVARSSKRSVGRALIRGIKLILLGYVLNFVRFCIPILVGAELLGVRAEPGEFLSCLFMVDILQVAGLSLIVLALLLRYIPNSRSWLAAACLILILSPFLWGRWSHIPGTKLLWGVGENVLFPLFPWLFYPLLGMVLSDRLRNPNGPASRRVFRFGWILLGSGLLLLGLPSRGPFVLGDYFRSGVTTHALITGFVFLWLGLCRLLTERLPQNRAITLLTYWSQNVTVVYVVHWIVIGWGTLVLDSNTLSSQIAMLIGLVVVLLSHFGLRIGSAIFKRSCSKPESK